MSEELSHRTAQLAASCMQTLARRELGMTISLNEASSLVFAHKGELRSALGSLSVTSEMHGAKSGGRLAVAEAVIRGGAPSNVDFGAIAMIRQETRDASRLRSDLISGRRAFVRQQIEAKRVAQDWVDRQTELLDGLEGLYSKTSRRLNLLGLSESDQQEFNKDLEAIFRSAIERGA